MNYSILLSRTWSNYETGMSSSDEVVRLVSGRGAVLRPGRGTLEYECVRETERKEQELREAKKKEREREKGVHLWRFVLGRLRVDWLTSW